MCTAPGSARLLPGRKLAARKTPGGSTPRAGGDEESRGVSSAREESLRVKAPGENPAVYKSPRSSYSVHKTPGGNPSARKTVRQESLSA